MSPDIHLQQPIIGLHLQVAEARREAAQARKGTAAAYENVAQSSAKLENRIENNHFHIKLEKAIKGKKHGAKK